MEVLEHPYRSKAHRFEERMTPENNQSHTGGVSTDYRQLQTLVDEGRVEELLQQVSVECVTETWLRYDRTQSHPKDADDDPDWWAVELWMSNAWWADEVRVRDALLRLIDAADDEALSSVAAGPLEVFVTGDASRLAWIEKQAALSEWFRRALAQVWAWELPRETFARLERAARAQLPQPDH